MANDRVVTTVSGGGPAGSGKGKDTVFIRNLAVESIIGIHPWERKTKQTVLISLDIGTDTTQAAVEDDIACALDYDTLAQRVGELVSGTEFQLIETLAERVARLVLEDSNAISVTVEVQKPDAISNADAVGVRIDRVRDN